MSHRNEFSSRELKLPEEGEVVGVVAQLLGFDRVKVKCADGKVRICRIPGKMKKKIWLRLNDVVLVAPWDFQSDLKGDIIWRYDRGNFKDLKAKGYLDNIMP
ncbi:MAG: translation initiation factor eIF-1A [Candidatus Methanomethylicia archaeon]|uniref:Translation initiation factor 1A n=1 Tax=Candidatus Methanomethylicus mesodigestus TaxID=1867258 RepID=A0A7C3ESQ0_9CREN|nr:translation initiation factor eIF-1A [Candidatus Methanomethylicia archaeon]